MADQQILRIPILQEGPGEVRAIAAIEIVLAALYPPGEDGELNWRHDRELQSVAAYIHEKYAFKPERAT